MAGRTELGESGSTFVVQADDGAQLIFKLEPAARAEAHRRGARVCAHLAGLGYPAPRVVGAGLERGYAYILSERLPGAPMSPQDGRQVARLTDLLELQADGAAAAGLPPDQWSASVVDPVRFGGAGYCLLETMRAHSAESASLLDRLQAIVAEHGEALPAPADIVHYDFNPANILVDAHSVSGVVDWEGARAGDRAFDLATLLFYLWEAPGARAALQQRLAELRQGPVVAVYLAHVILRQVEWSLRLHAPDVGRRYLDRAEAVLADWARR